MTRAGPFRGPGPRDKLLTYETPEEWAGGSKPVIARRREGLARDIVRVARPLRVEDIDG